MSFDQEQQRLEGLAINKEQQTLTALTVAKRRVGQATKFIADTFDDTERSILGGGRRSMKQICSINILWHGILSPLLLIFLGCLVLASPVRMVDSN